jgi:hypothetical protein
VFVIKTLCVTVLIFSSLLSINFEGGNKMGQQYVKTFQLLTLEWAA